MSPAVVLPEANFTGPWHPNHGVFVKMQLPRLASTVASESCLSAKFPGGDLIPRRVSE